MVVKDLFYIHNEKTINENKIDFLNKLCTNIYIYNKRY